MKQPGGSIVNEPPFAAQRGDIRPERAGGLASTLLEECPSGCRTLPDRIDAPYRFGGQVDVSMARPALLRNPSQAMLTD